MKNEIVERQKEIIKGMTNCTTIKQWNELREEAKKSEGNTWVSRNIDASGLIGKSSIKNKPGNIYEPVKAIVSATVGEVEYTEVK